MYFVGKGICPETGMYKIVDIDDSENIIYSSSGYLTTSLIEMLNNNFIVVNHKLINSDMNMLIVKYVQILSIEFTTNQYIVDFIIYYDIHVPVECNNSADKQLTDWNYVNSTFVKASTVITDTIIQSIPSDYKIHIGLNETNLLPTIKKLVYAKKM